MDHVVDPEAADPYLDEYGISDEDLAAPGQVCCCEPCPRCEAGEAHEVPWGCLEYPCLRCEARERLTGEVPVAFGGVL